MESVTRQQCVSSGAGHVRAWPVGWKTRATGQVRRPGRFTLMGLGLPASRSGVGFTVSVPGIGQEKERRWVEEEKFEGGKVVASGLSSSSSDPVPPNDQEPIESAPDVGV
jgi:hypothetical protein